uniref:Uncharacterized protein n=1 Tax=Steinernema glaseri TaxID=37863 RepID=A0A1I7YEN3_9BILA
MANNSLETGHDLQHYRGCPHRSQNAVDDEDQKKLKAEVLKTNSASHGGEPLTSRLERRTDINGVCFDWNTITQHL